jgi:hypothetical protein
MLADPLLPAMHLADLALAAAAGGATSWTWSAISWMALPWHHATFLPFRDEDAVCRAIAANADRSGVYGIPASRALPAGASPEERAAWDRAAQQRLRDGPLLLAVVSRGGYPPVWRPMLVALLVAVAVSAIFAALLAQTSLATFAGRTAFVGAAGLAGAMLCRLPDWNWHGFSASYTAVAVADAAIGWTLGGAAIAAVLPLP